MKNSKAKDKLGYWQKKYSNMRRAKELKPKSRRAMELDEELRWKHGQTLCSPTPKS